MEEDRIFYRKGEQMSHLQAGVITVALCIIALVMLIDFLIGVRRRP